MCIRLLLLGYPLGVDSDLLAGTVKLGYCGVPFAGELPTWSQSVKGTAAPYFIPGERCCLSGGAGGPLVSGRAGGPLDGLDSGGFLDQAFAGGAGGFWRIGVGGSWKRVRLNKNTLPGKVYVSMFVKVGFDTVPFQSTKAMETAPC